MDDIYARWNMYCILIHMGIMTVEELDKIFPKA